MFEGNSFGKTIGILHKSMDVGLLRRQVIANNIANAETPGFKRSEVNFESQLKRALDSEKTGGAFEPLMNNPLHMNFDKKLDWNTVQPKTILDSSSSVNNNGNNVDIEEEMMSALENQLLYQTQTDAVAGLFKQINIVLR
ncbi:flagellar basal body rod protein FlgB [Spirochaeta cellobiosiphila]|uniref:flagellar basal body rod protein FlgB n=1 Tax=Spirochaeta cellobiosiphila TaxID=504483 RepID=UPI0003F77546|nr:flagellar basal body rod protein FlgB [Spirochaeta cellobiosiphila]